MIRRILFLSCAAGAFSGAWAQSADWRVNPRYSSIEPFTEGLYKVREGRKTGIIDANGHAVVPVKYDRITPFYEGLAVICDNAPEGGIIRGVISETGEVNFADDRYYLFPEYTFFSEGYIPVIEPGGKYGYLTSTCQPAFRFIEDEVRPFSEGQAAIGQGEDFRMIDSYGEAQYIMLPDGEYAFGGTNYYNGKTLVWDGDWVCYILDSSGRLEKLGKMDLRDLEVDYLYRFGTGNIQTSPKYARYTPAKDKEWKPAEKNGRWTFTNATGKPLTTYSYESVEPFSDGVAIASLDGKYGLLEVVEDNSTFYSTVSTSRHTYSPGKDVKCTFTLSVPEKWVGQNLSVVISDPSTGETIPFDHKGSQYTFTAHPEGKNSTEEKIYDIVVRHNGTNIWQGEAAYEFHQRAKVQLQAAIRLQNADANSKDQCIVVATIKNPSSSPVTTTVTLSGGGNKASFAGRSVTVTIPPYGTKTVSGAFTVRKVELNGWCAVSTSDGASARRSGLQLKPF